MTAARIGLERHEAGTPLFSEILKEVIVHFLACIAGKEALLALQNMRCTTETILGKKRHENTIATGSSSVKELAHATVGQELPQAG